jgi:hypothetical protein
MATRRADRHPNPMRVEPRQQRVDNAVIDFFARGLQCGTCLLFLTRRCYADIHARGGNDHSPFRLRN